MQKPNTSSVRPMGLHLVLLLGLLTPAAAQTWQKQGNASIPIVVEGTACNSATHTMGVSSDRSQVLSCQSGVWSVPALSNKTCSRSLLQTTTVGGICFDSSIGENVYFAGVYMNRFIVTRKVNEIYPQRFGREGVAASTNFDNGSLNTPLLKNSPAVDACTLWGNGWYLPALREFENALWPARQQLGFGANDMLWLSQERGEYYAYIFSIANGRGYNTADKAADMFYVRCIKSY